MQSKSNLIGEESHFPRCFVPLWRLLLISATLSAEESSDGLYASVHVHSRQQIHSEEYKAVYDFEAQVPCRSTRPVNLFCAWKVVSWRLVFCLCSAIRRALSVLWRRCGCHWPGWGRLVDGTKKWPQRAGSRILSHKSVTQMEDSCDYFNFAPVTVLSLTSWLNGRYTHEFSFIIFIPPLFVWANNGMKASEQSYWKLSGPKGFWNSWFSVLETQLGYRTKYCRLSGVSACAGHGLLSEHKADICNIHMQVQAMDAWNLINAMCKSVCRHS